MASFQTSCSLKDHYDIWNPRKFNDLQQYTEKHNSRALDRITFLERPKEDHLHLDLGCGPGTFTKNRLVPLSLPCKRIAAVDKSPGMIEFARKHSTHENITFDVFDFCGVESGNLIAKYGHFDRIYSLACFHYINDQGKAFKELARLLKPESGECLVSAAVSTAIFDAWFDLSLMERWREVIPDPKLVFSKQLSFHFAKSKTEVESDVRRMVSEAGLKCVALHVYEAGWPFSDVFACADAVFEGLNFSKYVAMKDVENIKADLARALNGGRVEEHGEYSMKAVTYCVHAQSAPVRQ